MDTGKPVSSRMRLSRFFKRAPPPVSTMPRSLMSADSSGRCTLQSDAIALRIVAPHSPKRLPDFAVVNG